MNSRSILALWLILIPAAALAAPLPVLCVGGTASVPALNPALHSVMLYGLVFSWPVWGKHWHEDQDDWNWHVQLPQQQRQQENDHAGHRKDKGCYFEPRDLRVISKYYASLYASLPRVPESKFRRNGQLPPGWEARMQLIPVEVETQLIPVPVGYRRGIIDGFAVVYNLQSAVIIDVTPLFGGQ